MVSIEDVAQRAGVSVATVSRALRGLPNVATATRLRVEAAARDLDYVSDPSAARLAAGRTKTLGLVLPNLGTWYGGRFAAAVHQVWNDAGFDLLVLVVDTHSERTRFLRDLPFRKRVDGLLLLDVPFEQEEYERLLETEVGVVAAGPRTENVPSIGIDDRSAARSVVEHLLDLGHEDIALLEGGIDQPFQWAGAAERKGGFVDALAAADIRLPAARCMSTDWSPASGARAMERLLDSGGPIPTAVACFSDELAIGAMSVLAHRGIRVPHDMAVAGFDDHDLAVHLDLTTVHQPVSTIGARAAARLVDRVTTGEEELRHEVLPTRLVARATTAGHRGGTSAMAVGASAGRVGDTGGAPA